MNKRIFAALLAALLLSSCGAEEPASETETAADTAGTVETAETEETLAGPDVPDTTYGGADFTIYSRVNTEPYFVVEEQTGDLLNDARFDLMAMLEEKFAVDMIEVQGADDTYGDKARDALLAGDTTYEMLSGHYRIMCTAYAQNELAHDWCSLPYIDFENEWWDKNMLEGLSIGGKMYVLTDDLTVDSIRTTKCFLINKDLFREYGIDLPYEAALDGTWTFDMFAEICEQFSSDLNGDGKLDPEHDLFGFTSTGWGTPMNILWTAGQRIVDFTGEGGRMEYVLNNEITVDVYDTFFAFMNQDCAYLAKDINVMYSLFREGRAAIRGAGMGDIYTERDMEYDIGVMPCPKFYAEQENYCTGVDAGSNGLVIPVTVEDPDMVSAVAEYWAYLQYRDVLPVFYEKVCKTKAARDEETALILDLVRDSRFYDIGYFYGSLPMNSIGYDLSSGGNFASYYARNEAKGQAALDEINAYYFGE